MTRAITLFVAVLALVCAAACTGSTEERKAMPVSAAQAAEFGEVTLPDGVDVIGTSTDGAIDTRYELALRVNAAQLADLLAKSRFTTPVTPSDYGKDRKVIAGPSLSTATDLRYAQDRVDTPDHGTVTREIFEDHRSPDEVYVHLFMFTT